MRTSAAGIPGGTRRTARALAGAAVASLALLGTNATAVAAPTIPTPPTVVDGFEAPESAFWSERANAWFVSNYGGAGFGDGVPFDGNGFVSRLDRDGTVVDRAWSGGFDDPNGIRGWRDRLAVADVDRVVVLDVATGERLREIVVPGARLLNDVAVDGRTGDLYVSDTLTDTIWRVTAAPADGRGRPVLGGGDLEPFVQGPQLESPNGLLVDRSTLLVGTVGPGLDPTTFATDAPGQLLAVDLHTRAVAPFGTAGRLGLIDGIERDGRGYLVSDASTGRVLRVTRTGVETVFQAADGQAADIGFDPRRGLVAVPALSGTTVTFVVVPDRRR